MRKFWMTTLLATVMGLSGCTIYGVKNPPTLKSSTSAEQYERIFWTAVKEKKWQALPGMLGANVMYSAGGKLLSKDQVQPYLQGLNVADFTITRNGGQAKRPRHEPELHLANLLSRGLTPNLHGNQRLAASRFGLDPHRAHRTTAGIREPLVVSFPDPLLRSITTLPFVISTGAKRSGRDLRYRLSLKLSLTRTKALKGDVFFRSSRILLFAKHFQESSIHTEISPLRFASVEMTKGGGAPPERQVAEQKPFFTPPRSN